MNTSVSSFETCIMTVKEAADFLDISESYMYVLLGREEIAFERRGRRKLPVAESVAEYKQRNLVTAKPTKQPPATGSGYGFRHLNNGRAARQ